VVDLCKEDLSRSEYVLPIATIAGEGARVMHYSEVGGPDVEGADAIVVCGTALRDDDYLEHLDDFEMMARGDTPALGICAGMQVIALRHGARVKRAKEIGMTPIEPVTANPLVPAPMEVYSLHKFDLEGMDGFDVLARSADSIQAIAHRELPLWGIMFHPEVRRGGVVSRFLDLAREIAGG
jgi:GMP synthase (glutamine-hydrolysing)